MEQSVTFSTLVALGMFRGRWFPANFKKQMDTHGRIQLPAYRPYKHIYMIDMCALICPFCLLFFSHTCATDASYCCLPGSLHTDT